jgi:hypothetical protein
MVAVDLLSDLRLWDTPSHFHFPCEELCHDPIASTDDCRSGPLGSTLYQCTGCGRKHWVHWSCGNRYCPLCQQHKTRQWLDQQQARQLPVPYFMLTFTVPSQLRHFLRSHKKAGYEALFRASSQAIRKLARDP